MICFVCGDPAIVVYHGVHIEVGGTLLMDLDVPLCRVCEAAYAYEIWANTILPVSYREDL